MDEIDYVQTRGRAACPRAFYECSVEVSIKQTPNLVALAPTSAPSLAMLYEEEDICMR